MNFPISPKNKGQKSVQETEPTLTLENKGLSALSLHVFESLPLLPGKCHL
jgi:hypothetical protein